MKESPIDSFVPLHDINIFHIIKVLITNEQMNEIFIIIILT